MFSTNERKSTDRTIDFGGDLGRRRRQTSCGRKSAGKRLTASHVGGESAEGLEEGEPRGVGEVGSEDGGDDGTDLNASLVFVSVAEVVLDLLDEVGQVEGRDAVVHGVQQVGDSSSGVSGDLVGNSSPVGDDGVETAVFQAVSDRDEANSVD